MTRLGRCAHRAATAGVLALSVSLAGCSLAGSGSQTTAVQLPQSTTAAPAAPVPYKAVSSVTGGRWLSGASGDAAANGTYGKWRHAAVAVGGTWDNGDSEQVQLESICPGGMWSHWNKPLDIAIGAIDKTAGESWAAAAKGAYDARWTKSLTRMKTCWAQRDARNLYIRFAHEMNLGSMPWNVTGAEATSFIKAITRFSNLRYKILPRANIVLCPTDGSDSSLGLDVRQLWPGLDAAHRRVVNVFAVDTYNGYVVVHDAAEFDSKIAELDSSGYLFGLETYRQFAQDKGVPFAVGEWSNNGDPKNAGQGGEEPEYVRDMNQWFRAHGGDPSHPRPGQLLYEIQFNLQEQFSFLPTAVQPKTAKTYASLVWGH